MAAHQASRPWDSPGKNTGVGCHSLLQCMKVKSESEATQSCPTPSDPMDCSLPDSSLHGIFQTRVLEWGAIAFSGLEGYMEYNPQITFLCVACLGEVWLKKVALALKQTKTKLMPRTEINEPS